MGKKNEFNMKNKIFFIFIATAIFFIAGKAFYLQPSDIAYAQVEMLDGKTEDKRNTTDEPILEEEKKVELPTKVPTVNP